MFKAKTHKGLKKRTKVTARGKIMHKRANAGHLMSCKNGKRRRRLRRHATLSATEAAKVKRLMRK